MKAVTITQISPEEFQALINDSINSVLRNQQQETKRESLEPLFTREEAANHLKIDLSTLSRWSKKGTIQSYGVGNRVYYKLEDIKKALVKL